MVLVFEEYFNGFRNEEQKRLMIFTENFLKAEEHNQGNSLYTRGINQFSDMTQNEWEEIHLTGYKRMVPGKLVLTLCNCNFR